MAEQGLEWVPAEFMRRALRWLLSHGAGGLFADPGLRKTSVTLAAIKVLKSEGVGPFLVVAPRRVCLLVWPDERLKWRAFHSLAMEVMLGTAKQRAAMLRRKADVYVINPEALDWLFAECGRLGRWPFAGLVVDESTKFKNSRSLRFKLLKMHLGRFRRRWILTGTPAPRGLLDLFGQAYIMDMGAALGQYITHYRSTYFLPSGFGGFSWKLKEDGAGSTEATEAAIYERLAPLVLRLDEKDHLDLPGLIGVDPPLLVEVELPPAARKVYDDMEEHLIADVLGDAVTAANAAVASMKCRQVANGGLYTDAKARQWKNLHDAKTDAVEELAEQLQGKPLLISVDFEHDVDRLRRRFGERLVVFAGGTSDKEARRIQSAWNAGDIELLAANPQSAAWGLNLQERGRHICLHSLTWNYEQYDQFIRRVYRSGVSGRVTVHHVVARGTVDEALMRATRSKAKTQGALLDALRDYARGRRASPARPRARRAA